MGVYSIRNIKNCIARSTLSHIPCMHSALHSSIIAYSNAMKRSRLYYIVRKGLHSEKKVFDGNG